MSSSTIKILAPSGLLDSPKANKFREEVNQAVSEGIATVLIDFDDVSFMDSSGLGALVLALKTVRGAGGEMYVCSINDQIRMLFELTSMDRVFTIFPSREDFENYIYNN